MKNIFTHLNKGFTYLELVVVVSLVAILSSVLIFNYGSFDANVKLNNLAQDIALSIKQAQTVAISGGYGDVFSYGFQNPDLAGIAPTYGIWFDTQDPTLNNDKGFAFFVDRPIDFSGGGYRADSLDSVIDLNPIDCQAAHGACDDSITENRECQAVTKITSLDKISGIFYEKDNGLAGPIFNLGITFTRPFPNAKFGRIASVPGDGSSAICLDSPDVVTNAVYIEIESQRDTTKKKHITVYASGQITVSDGGCDVNDSEANTCK